MTTVINLSQLGSRGFAINGFVGSEYAGSSVSWAGDVNSDGLDDVIIGAFSNDAGGNNSGGAYVIFGASGERNAIDLRALSPTDGFLIEGARRNNDAGSSVFGAGDFNGDGYADMIIGAPSGRSQGGHDGRAYIVYGGPDPSGPLNLAQLDPAQGVMLTNGTGLVGEGVSYAGDVNGDGIDDVIASAPFSDNGGQVYVLYGRTDGVGNVDLSLLTPSDGFVIHGAADSEVGRGATSAGDVNGDGMTDLIIGAPGNSNDPGGAAGTAYVIFGRIGGYGDIDLTRLAPSDGFAIRGAAQGDHVGFATAAAGDVNGDGYADLLVGTPGGDLGGNEAGQAYVIFGKDSGFGDIDLAHLAPADGFVIQGAKAGGMAGFSVASAGDVNGDGFADVIIGAYHYGFGRGRAYVIYGKADGFGALDLSTLKDADGFALDNGPVNTGVSVSAAGDINGDGFADVIVGSMGDSSYVVYGVAPTDAVTRTGTAVANTIRGGFGDDVLDGRGGDDLLFGAQGNDQLLGGDGNDALTGSEGDDALVGDEGKDTLEGQGGNDDLNGGDGNDKLVGGVGNDIMHGGDGKDRLSGGAGDDALYGGTGKDLLSGGGGADRFHFSLGGTAADAKNADRIADFHQSQHDRIDLTDYDADPSTPATDPFHFVGTVAFSGAIGEVRYELAGDDTLVSGDTNGDKAADFTIRLTGTFTLAEADFLLVAEPTSALVGHAFLAHPDLAGNALLHLV